MTKEEFVSEQPMASLPDIGVTKEACEIPYNFCDPAQFRKVESLERLGISANAFLQLVPSVIASDTLANAYLLRFPEGVEGTLMKLHQGGVASTIVGYNKKIAGTASLFRLDKQAVLFSTFSLISFATGQYFLSNISREMSLVNQKLDAVLDFLETEKYTDLLSELEFVQYAVKNYLSIMLHDSQRLATLTNIQHSKTQSIANIHFYLKELKNLIDKSTTASLSQGIKFTRKRLDLACQLYTISTIMEAYYSQNFDSCYLNSVLEDADQLLELVSNKERLYLTNLAGKSQSKKAKFGIKAEKICSSELDDLIAAFTNQTKNPKVKVIETAFSELNKQTNLYILQNGDIYQQIT